MFYVNGTARCAQNGQLSMTPNGKVQGKVRVAFSRTYRDAKGELVERTSFVDLIAWGKTGEALASRIRGEQIAVNGRLEVSTNKANGTTYTNVSVVVNEVTYLTTKEQRDQLRARNEDLATEASEAPAAEAEVEDFDGEFETAV